MNIPKEFKLFGNTIKVVFDNKECDKDDCYGLARYKTDTIVLQNEAHGRAITREEIETVFLHEVIHFILNRLKYSDLDNNEQFITQFSRALHQVLTTQK